MEILSKEFQEKVASELKIVDLATDNINNISLQHFYLQLYIDYRYSMSKTESILESIYQELYDHYKFEFNKELKSTEIDLYLKADKKYKDVNKTYQKIKVIVEYLEGIVKLFTNRGFALKNSIDLEKLKRGG